MPVRSLLLASSMVLALASAPAMACMGKTVLFEDDFSVADPSWGAVSNIFQIKDKKAIIAPDEDKAVRRFNQTGIYDNIDLCVKITNVRTDDPTTSDAGLIFWSLDSNSYYLFDIASNGYYRVSRWAGRWLNPISWTKTDLIKEGPGQVNELRVVTKGNQATIFLNGKQAATFRGQPPRGGQIIGISASSPAKGTAVWEFQDFKATDPGP